MSTRANSDAAELVQALRRSLHELNNALTPILANAQLAGLLLNESPADVREALDDVVEAAGRANAQVRFMREIATELHDAVEGTNVCDGSQDADGTDTFSEAGEADHG